MQPKDQIEKLHEAMTLLNRGNATTEDVVRLFELSLKATESIKAQLEAVIDSNQGEVTSQTKTLKAELVELQGALNALGQKLETSDEKQSLSESKLIKSSSQQLTQISGELARIESLIPTLPDLKPLDNRISEVERKIPAPFILDGEIVVEKINDIPPDGSKIDASHIKNLAKYLPKQDVAFGFGGSGGVRGLTAGTNISISDDPTYAGFKVISATDSAVGTVTSASVVTANGISGTVATPTTTPAITLTLGAITPSSITLGTFTLGSVIFAGTGGLVTEDNAGLFFNSTSNRLGVGTATPLSVLHLAGPGDVYIRTDSRVGGGAASASGWDMYDNGVQRWGFINNTSNDFKLNRYDASGVFVDQPMTISGSNGIFTIAGQMSKTGGVTYIGPSNAIGLGVDGSGNASVNKAAIATTSTDSMLLSNNTAATAGVPVQIAPRLRWRSNVWNTTTPANNTNDFWIDSAPVSGTAPSGLLRFVSSLNGAAGVTRLSLSSGGVLTLAGGLQSTGDQQMGAGAILYWATRSTLLSPANGQFNLNNLLQTAGIGFDVTTDALIKIRTRAQTGNAALSVGSDAIAVTSTDGLIVANDTASTAGVPVQQSPRIRLRSQVWNTTSVANMTDDWWIESVPASGAAPGANSPLLFKHSMNGGASVTAASLTENGFTVPGAMIVGQGLYFSWANRGRMSAPSDGVVTFLNNGGSDFGRLQFGGTTSSFPALKRSTTTLAVRLADDSADASITALAMTLSAPTNVTQSVLTTDATQTVTLKRIQPRIVSAASYTTDTGASLSVATADQFVITAQAGALKFNNPGGTPTEGESLIIRIKDNGTARALTYDTQFRAMGNALPTTTVLSKTLYLGLKYNATDTKWDLVASAQEV